MKEYWQNKKIPKGKNVDKLLNAFHLGKYAYNDNIKTY